MCFENVKIFNSNLELFVWNYNTVIDFFFILFKKIHFYILILSKKFKLVKIKVLKLIFYSFHY